MPLIDERKRRQWSQQEVADRLGTTRINISRWEQGQTTPGPYFRAKLCELFGKRPHELGLLNKQSVEESQPTLPSLRHGSSPSPARPAQHVPLWSVPFSRNPFFTGREHLLQSLHDMLTRQGQVTALTQSYALHGLGGVGKTQIALEYAYRYRHSYRAIFWVSAETSETVLTSLVAIAEVLDLPERDAQDHHKIIRAVTRWLGEHHAWLLVCDNVEDLTLLHSFLPPTRQGSLLLTTRLQAVGTIAQQLQVNSLDAEGTGVSRPPGQSAPAKQRAQRTGTRRYVRRTCDCGSHGRSAAGTRSGRSLHGRNAL